MKRLVVLSTCGTSVLTNGASQEDQGWLRRIANANTLEAADDRRLKAWVLQRRETLAGASAAARQRLSAELNGVAAVQRRWPAAGTTRHLLLHTDTAVGRQAAACVEDALREQGGSVELLTAGGLRTSSFEDFRCALTDLTKTIHDRRQGWDADAGLSVVFNLTGGFKSVNGFLQALGMLYADHCVFLFDGASELMEIPKLPVTLDSSKAVTENLTVFRRLAVGYPVTEQDARGVPETLLLYLDGRVALSVWGDVEWSRVRAQLMGGDLLAPLSPKLRLSDGVFRSFANQKEQHRKETINLHLDALSAHLDLSQPMLKSARFQKLQSKLKAPSTHELYLWSDQDAWRLFGHFEGSEFVADSIGRHL